MSALAVAVLAVAALLTACGPARAEVGGTKAVQVTMTEFKFQPASLTVTQGQPVTVTLQNRGAVAHNFMVSELTVASPNVEPGQAARVVFTPARSGTFRFVCTVPGHEAAGMVGQVIVQAG